MVALQGVSMSNSSHLLLIQLTYCIVKCGPSFAFCQFTEKCASQTPNGNKRTQKT